MRYAMGYHAQGVRSIMREVRKSAQLGEKWNLACLQMAFAFAGILGYPVICFHQCLLKKGLAQ